MFSNNSAERGAGLALYNSLTCDIPDHTGYITREGTVWVGVKSGVKSSLTSTTGTDTARQTIAFLPRPLLT